MKSTSEGPPYRIHFMTVFVSPNIIHCLGYLTKSTVQQSFIKEIPLNEPLRGSHNKVHYMSRLTKSRVWHHSSNKYHWIIHYTESIVHQSHNKIHCMGHLNPLLATFYQSCLLDLSRSLYWQLFSIKMLNKLTRITDLKAAKFLCYTTIFVPWIHEYKHPGLHTISLVT